MKSKDKQIRELRKDRKYLFWVGVLAGIFILQMFFIIAGITGNNIIKLEQQLESCQEKVPDKERYCFEFKEGVSMKTIKSTWNHGEGILFPRDFEEIDCGVIE